MTHDENPVDPNTLPADASAAPEAAPLESGPIFQHVFVEPPVREIWKGRDLLIFVVVAFAWLLVSEVLSLSAYAAIKPIAGWQTPPSDIIQNAVFVVAAQVVYYGPLFVYIFVLVSVQYRLPFWEGIRWRWPGGTQAVKIFLSGIVLAIGLLIVHVWLPEGSKTFPLEKLFSSTASAYALAAFSVTLAPFMEELIFRGVLFAFFEKMAGVRFALVSTAVLFAAIHAPEYWGAWSGLALILVVGLVCSAARALTRSVVPGVILHVAYNGTLMSMLFVGSHHFHNLQAVLFPPG